MAIISVLLGFLIVRVFGDATWFHDNAELMTMGLIKLGVWLSTFLLITKFGFPKLTIQDTIKNDPIAVAVLVGFVAVAVALVL
jgi:hypothetical protein